MKKTDSHENQDYFLLTIYAYHYLTINTKVRTVGGSWQNSNRCCPKITAAAATVDRSSTYQQHKSEEKKPPHPRQKIPPTTTATTSIVKDRNKMEPPSTELNSHAKCCLNRHSFGFQLHSWYKQVGISSLVKHHLHDTLISSTIDSTSIGSFFEGIKLHSNIFNLVQAYLNSKLH